MAEGLYKGPEGEALRFYWEAEKNEARSEREGRPIFNKVLMVEVTAPGQRDSTPHFVITRQYEGAMFPEEKTTHYDRYKDMADAFLKGEVGAHLTGTPLSAWSALDVAQVEQFRHAGVYTVDALAALPDEKLRLLGPSGRTLRERAQNFLEQAADAAPMDRLTAENVELRERLAALEARLNGAEGEQSGTATTTPITPTAGATTVTVPVVNGAAPVPII